MSAIDALVEELNEYAIRDNVTQKLDNASLQYKPSQSKVRDFAEFTIMLAQYIQYIYSSCFTHGGWRSNVDAAGIAKELLSGSLTPRDVDTISIYQDCRDGLNGGVGRCMDILCEGLKRQAVERYVRDVFDRHLPHDDPDLRLRMVEQFMDRYKPVLAAIDRDRPWRYAKDIEHLIRAVVSATEQMASVYRRL